jgi:hypothetical protein
MKPLLLPALVAAALALPAAAGSAPPDPLDARAAVPPAVYASPLPRGRSAEATPVPWREANDRVTRIGGWRVYAREAASPEPASASAPAAPSAASAPTMRHHHGGPR